MNEIPHLIIEQEGKRITFHLVNASFWTLGRADSNDIVLSDRYCSSNHAVIQSMEPKSFYLIDLGSMNGSFVNDKRISIPVQLKPNDKITLGTTQMSLVCPETKSPEMGEVHRKGDHSTVMLQKKKLITALVIDIRNYTKLTQLLQEQLLSQVIGKWFSEAWNVLQRYGSGADKYIGDAIMAVWIHEASANSEESLNPKEILRVLQALNDLYQVSDALNDRFTLPFRLKIGAGVNTGQAIVGQMSAGGRPEYTAIGDSVNAAFRLESSTKEVGVDIALGEETYNHVPRSKLLNFERRLVSVKNYDHPLPAFVGNFSDLQSYLREIEKIANVQKNPKAMEEQNGADHTSGKG